jgi:hypothetical protein
MSSLATRPFGLSFREWLDLLGDDGIGVPYLRYASPPDDDLGHLRCAAI